MTICDLKTKLAYTSKDNVTLRKKIYNMKSKSFPSAGCLSSTSKLRSLKHEPVSNSWIAPIDEPITPIRHPVMYKGDIISQD